MKHSTIISVSNNVQLPARVDNIINHILPREQNDTPEKYNNWSLLSGFNKPIAICNAEIIVEGQVLINFTIPASRKPGKVTIPVIASFFVTFFTDQKGNYKKGWATTLS